jgi:hypothetical protein
MVQILLFLSLVISAALIPTLKISLQAYKKIAGETAMSLQFINVDDDILSKSVKMSSTIECSSHPPHPHKSKSQPYR